MSDTIHPIAEIAFKARFGCEGGKASRRICSGYRSQRKTIKPCFEVERGRFVEDTAQAWQDSREIEEDDVAKERQQALVSQVEKAAARFGCGFDDIARPINTRTNEIKSGRHRDRGLSDGLGL